MEPPLGDDEKSPTPPSSSTSRPPRAPLPSPSSSLEVRLFYVRISPCAPDAVPPHLALSHLRKSPSSILEINGARNPTSDPSSISLRRDRVDRDLAEVTYVSTDSVRLSGAVDIEISDDRGNLILCGSLDRTDALSSVQHHAPSSSDEDPKTGWTMDCCTAASITSSAFVQPKLGISSPSFEVYVAGCFAGSPLILTQTVHLVPRRKVARLGDVDSLLEDDETLVRVPGDEDEDGSQRRKGPPRKVARLGDVDSLLEDDETPVRVPGDGDEDGSQRRKGPPPSSMDSGDEDMDLVQIQRAGLSVIVACTTLMLELLRRREIICPTEPSMYRDIRRNANMQRMIGGGRDSCTDFIRMDQPAFYRLVDLLRKRSLLRDTIHVSVEEQLAMFLHTLGHSSSNRAMKAGFNRSGETISRYFNLVLGAMCSLRDEFVRLPGLDTDPEISNNPSYYPWFKDCIGLVGGAHIEATIPAEVIGHFRGRKGRSSPNVVAVVTHDMRFGHVLAGWEGLADNPTLLKDALSTPHSDESWVFEGKYYLTDGGFTMMPGFIAPYQFDDYHLNHQPGYTPKSSKELFNLRHSSFCSKVNTAFGILKKRFKILSSHPSFPFLTLVDILLACCVIHNYILEVDPNDKFLNEEFEVIDDEEEQGYQSHCDVTFWSRQTDETRQWVALRDKIADDMWFDYSRHNLQ